MSEGINVGALVASLGMDIDEFIDALNAAQDAIDDAGKGVDNATKSWQDSFDKVGKKMEKVGKSLTTWVTLPILAAGAASFKMASDMNESINKVDVAFKDQAGTVKAWSKDTLDAFGISQGAALDMAALYGDMATSMGLPTAEAAKMSMSLTGLAGDLASFKNIGIDQASTALSGIFTGETESLKRLGIVMTEFNLSSFAMEQGIQKQYKEMTQAEKTMLRYNYVMSVTKNSQGDFARTNEGAANQMRIFWESVKEVGATLGQVLIPIITPVIKKTNELLKWIKSLDDTTQKWIVGIFAAVAAIGPLLLIIGKTVQAVPLLVSGFSTLQTGITAVASAFAKASAFLMANPWILLATAIAAAAAAIYIFASNSDDAVSSSAELQNALKKDTAAANENFEAAKKTAEGTNSRKIAIETLNELYGSYLPNLLDEKSSLEDIETAQRAVNEALAQSYVLKDTEKQLKKYDESIADATETMSDWVALIDKANKTSDVAKGTNAGALQAFIGDMSKLPTAADRKDIVKFVRDLYGVNTNAQFRSGLVDSIEEVIASEKAKTEATKSLDVQQQAYLKTMGITLAKKKEEASATVAGTSVITEQIGILEGLKIALDNANDARTKATTDADRKAKDLEIAQIQAQIDAYDEEAKAIQDVIAMKKAQADMPDMATVTSKDVTEVSFKLKTKMPDASKLAPTFDAKASQAAMAAYDKSLQAAAASAYIYGDSYDYVGTQIAATETAMKDLADAGVPFNDPMFENLKATRDQLAITNESFLGTQEQLQAFQGAAQQGFNQIGQTVLEGLGLAEKGLEGFLGTLASTVIELLSMYLAQSIAAAIAGGSASGAATGPAAVFTTPAFIATAVGGVMAAFASIPEFADGGLIYGPTVGLMGEYPGAKSNPEVIAPLNKLQGMIDDSLSKQGGNTVGGRVKFEIEGTKLVGVLDNQVKKTKSYR